ncbi:hypothetical protein ACJQWK_07512 [Exserohilum turcicum]
MCNHYALCKARGARRVVERYHAIQFFGSLKIWPNVCRAVFWRVEEISPVAEMAQLGVLFYLAALKGGDSVVKNEDLVCPQSSFLCCCNANVQAAFCANQKPWFTVL